MLKRLRNRIQREISQVPVFRVSSDFAYQVALREHAGNLPTISSADLTIVESLRHEGIFVTSLEALAISSTAKLLQEAQSLTPTIQATSLVRRKEYVIHATSTQLMEYPNLFLWGLEEQILNMIESYLGLPVAYHGLYFRRDLANEVQIRSRLWHLDKEDHRIVKIIIYLNDVCEDKGPFQYIPKHLTSLTSKRLGYNYGYIKDKVMEPVVPKSEWRSCLGASGTVVIADTASIFHRGKPPVDSDRISIFFDYTSRQPKSPYYCNSSFSTEELLALAKILSERQKEYIFWR